MLNQIRRTIREKGQGLTEYVLILAFIAGVAFMMFGGNGSLKGTVVGTFTETVRILAGLFGEDDGYVTASKDIYRDKFKDWSKKSSEDLKNEASSAERLKADQEGLALIASLFLGKTKEEVAKLMGVGVTDPKEGYTNKHSNLQWVYDNLDADRMGPVTDDWSEVMVPLSYWNKDFDTDKYLWLECGNNNNLIKDMAGEDNTVEYKKKDKESQLGSRVFYSDGMIGDGTSERAVALKVHYNGDTVDKVWIAAQENTLTQYQRDGKIGEKVDNKGNKYTDSPGNSAFNGNSESIKGLDLTVTGTSENYKYKVNN